MWGRNKIKAEKEEKIGLVDNVTDRREGLIFIQHNSSDNGYRITDYKTSYNVVFEIKEIYNDKILSKVEIVNIPYNICDRKDAVTQNFNPWIDSSKIHWLCPSTPVARDNKLNEILN